MGDGRCRNLQISRIVIYDFRIVRLLFPPYGQGRRAVELLSRTQYCQQLRRAHRYGLQHKRRHDIPPFANGCIIRAIRHGDPGADSLLYLILGIEKQPCGLRIGLFSILQVILLVRWMVIATRRRLAFHAGLAAHT